jgi:hypothetical protein
MKCELGLVGLAFEVLYFKVLRYLQKRSNNSKTCRQCCKHVDVLLGNARCNIIGVVVLKLVSTFLLFSHSAFYLYTVLYILLSPPSPHQARTILTRLLLWYSS